MRLLHLGRAGLGRPRRDVLRGERQGQGEPVAELAPRQKRDNKSHWD